MAADKYLIVEMATGRFTQRAGTVVSAGSYNAGELVALDDDGRLDSSLLPEGGGIINPMIDSGDLIYGLIVPASNLALYSLGARATANSSYHSSNPNNTIDANDSTLHDGGGPVPGAWVTIDLQTPTAIGAWRLRQVPWGYDGGSVGFGVGNEHADGYTLASSDDNATWTDRFTFVTDAPDDTGIVLFGENITARYWRVLATTGGVWGWDIQTFGLYLVEPAVARLGIGDELQVLTVVDGLPAWADAAAGTGGGGLTSPMTALGDLIVGGAGATTNEATVTAGAGATASSSYSGFSPGAVIDLSDSVRWVPASTVGSGEWVQIDLGSTKEIVQYRIREDSVGNAHAWDLQWSVDGTAWTTIASNTNSDNPHETGLMMFSAPRTARYWRLLGITGTYGWNVYAIELYSGTVDGYPTRLGIGDELQVLTVVDGVQAWADPTGGGSTAPGILPAPDYDSGFVSMTVNVELVLAHGLGEQPSLFLLTYRDDSSATNEKPLSLTNYPTVGVWRPSVTATEFRLYTTWSYVAYNDAGSGLATVEVRVRAWKASDAGAALTNPLTTLGDLIIGGAAALVNEATTAKGAIATISAQYSSYAPIYVIDGDDATMGHSNSPATGQWYVIDLGSVKTITAYRILQGNVSGAYAYTLQSSTDNSSWTDRVIIVPATANSGYSHDTYQTALPSPITARYWRIYGTALSGVGWGVYSWELYSGIPAGAPTRLPIGDELQVLTVVEGVQAWADTAGMDDPMIALGDLIYSTGSAAYSNEALLSAGASATDNGTYETYAPANAIDGSAVTPWFGNQSGISWLKVDLGSAKLIAAWQVMHGDNSVPLANARNFVIQSSVDNSTWSDQDTSYSTLGSSTLDTGVVALLTPTRARYWRYYTTTHHGNGYGAGLFTFALYSGGGSGPARRAIGDELDVLTVVDGVPDWAAPAPALPPIGDEGQVLTVVSGIEAWADATGGGGGGGAVIGGGPGIIDAIYDAISISNVDPIDTIVELDDFVALIFFSSHNANGWKSASTSYTVPADMKLVVLGAWASDAIATDPGNRRARLYNSIDSTEVLGYSAFVGGSGSLQFHWDGDISTPSRFPEVAAGKAIRMELWNNDSNKRALAGVVILRLVPASGDYTPPLRGWSAAPGASLYLWGQYN